MALIKDFEIPNTGLVVSNAYHVIGDVRIDKRISKIPIGPNSDDPLSGEPGYIGQIFMNVFSSKESREQGLKPIAFLNAAMPEIDINFKFSYKPESSDSLLTQAYDHLKTTEYYKDSIES